MLIEILRDNLHIHVLSDLRFRIKLVRRYVVVNWLDAAIDVVETIVVSLRTILGVSVGTLVHILFLSTALRLLVGHFHVDDYLGLFAVQPILRGSHFNRFDPVGQDLGLDVGVHECFAGVYQLLPIVCDHLVWLQEHPRGNIPRRHVARRCVIKRNELFGRFRLQ